MTLKAPCYLDSKKKSNEIMKLIMGETIDLKNFFSNIWSKQFKTWCASPLSLRFFEDFDIAELYAKKILTLDDINILYDDERNVATTNTNKNLNDLLRDGATLQVRNAHKYSEKINVLYENMCEYFGGRISINFYSSRDPSVGIPVHYDVHHVLAIQTFGSKLWKLTDRPIIKPRVDYTPSLERFDYQLSNQILLKKGEVLYIPPGVVHKTETPKESSHFTIGIRVPDWTDLLQTLVKEISQKYDFLRDDLPFQFKKDQFLFKKLKKNDCKKAANLLKEALLNLC